MQQRQHVAHARHRLEELQRLLDRHVEHVGDRLALEQDLQRLAVVALALADVAGDVDVGQEVHLDLDDAVALAGLAAAALDVEREAAGLVAARLALGQAGEPLADRREGAGIGRGVRARRAADRRLVDVDDLVDVLEPLDAVVRGGGLRGAVELARHRACRACRPASVDLPPPETPVTQVNRPSGISAVMFLRLLPRALMTLSARRVLRGRRSGIGTDSSPERYLPVHDFGASIRSSTWPSATISPPWMPAPGPMSSTWSALRMASSSCSTTITVLPRSRRRLQGFKQPRIVALVQADRRLVENIQNTR